MRKITFILSAFYTLFSYQSLAEEYSLFNPTPDEKLRPLNSERSSESDYVTTIDPGRVQIESGLVNVSRYKNCAEDDCQKVSRVVLGDTFNVRLGLTENTDIQLISNLYTNSREENNNGLEEKDGFSDITLRFKYSFSGNKNEQFGLALIPQIKLPTNQNNLGNNDVEGGLGIPIVFNFANGFSIGGMTQFNLFKDQNSSQSYINSYYLHNLSAIYLSKNFTSKFLGVAELSSSKGNISFSKRQNSANFILHYLISKNFKIDGGVNFGLNDYAADLNYFAGFAYRF